MTRIGSQGHRKKSLTGFLSYTVVHNILLLGYAGLHICDKQSNCELEERIFSNRQLGMRVYIRIVMIMGLE